MIRRGTTAGGFVCLRCQFWPPRAKFQWSSAAAWYAQVRGNSTAADGPPRDGAHKRDANGDKPSVNGSPQQAPGARRSDGRVYTTRGTLVQPRIEGLDFDVLGKRGETIVMMDLGKRTKREFPPLILEVAEAETGLEDDQDIWGSALDLEAPTTEAEVQANIDELRPADVRILIQRDFDVIVDALRGGFTVAQLVRYIGANRKDIGANRKHRASVATPAADPDAPWILQRLAWEPQPPSTQQKPDTGKKLLVSELMRVCWGISIQEHVDGPGYMDIFLRDPEFSLLLVGNMSWLQVISRIYLRKVGGRIELRRSSRMLRIYSPKAIADTILAAINQVLRTTTTQTIDLRPIAPGKIPHESLERLGQLTNSHIRQRVASGKFDVSWIERNRPERDQTFEKTRDVVFRHLMSAYGSDAPSLPLPMAVVGPLLEGPEMARLVSERGLQNLSLPWNAPSGSWARFVRPVSSATTKSADVNLPPNLVSWLIRPQGDDTRTPPPQPSATSVSDPTGLPTIGHWALAKTSTHAIFGHILHWTEENDVISQPSTILPSDTSSPRILSTTTPPLFGRAFSKAAFCGPTSSQLVIRLVPSPNGSAAVHAPTLELRVRMINSLVADIKSLRALHNTYDFDLLLPDHPVDARITQKQVSELRRLGDPLDAHPVVLPLVDFLGQSEISPAEGVFKTPSLVKGMTVPVRLGHGAALGAGDESGLLTLDYLFAGLEVRHQAVTSFRDRSLAYTTIVSDGFTPQRVEVSMQASPWREPNPFKEGSEYVAERFVADVLKVAQGNMFQWFFLCSVKCTILGNSGEMTHTSSS
ncbi:hypothetical protein RB598_007063 [Gaeumannomyces tritici]